MQNPSLSINNTIIARVHTFNLLKLQLFMTIQLLKFQDLYKLEIIEIIVQPDYYHIVCLPHCNETHK